MENSVTTAFARYLEAKSRHDDARKKMAQAERVFMKLCRTMPDMQAYKLAGVSFADHRDIKASRAKREAMATLVSALPDDLTPEKVLILGRVMFLEADLKLVANDRGQPPHSQARQAQAEAK
jgi:hypothetical protein